MQTALPISEGFLAVSCNCWVMEMFDAVSAGQGGDLTHIIQQHYSKRIWEASNGMMDDEDSEKDST